MKGFNSLATSPSDVAARLHDIDALLERAHADALILGLRSNIAWATCGADLGLALSREQAYGFVVFTAGRGRVVAWVMDGERYAVEEAPAGFEVVTVHWNEARLEDEALRLAGEGRTLSDCGLPGTSPADAELRVSQYPLSPLESRRLSWIGERVDALCRAAADGLEPGVTERDAAAALSADFIRAGFAIDEIMMGFDDRVRRYRHPVPRDARLERLALIHPTVNRWGIHGIATRMVHFGAPPPQLVERLEACSAVEAWSIAMSVPATSFRTILEGERRAYAEHGYPAAWREHFQGGLTGYILHEPAHATRPDDPIPEGAILNWYPSLPGAKKEELTLATPEGGRVLTLTGSWPTQTVDTEAGPVTVAALYIR